MSRTQLTNNSVNSSSFIFTSTADPTISSNTVNGLALVVGQIWLNTTSGEMFSCTDATTDANVWTNVGDGTVGVPYMVATNTNGTEVIDPTDPNYKVVTFNTSGSFTPSIGVAGIGDFVEYLVIAGGGSGGTQTGGGGGGGGGAGGYLTATNFTVTAQTFTVTVGGGGAATSGGGEGASGENSVFSTITSIGGGRGQGNNDLGNSNGGSGGGGVDWLGTGGTGTAGQGNNGGSGHTGGAYGQGAGGGAGAVGANGTASVGGAGGAGLSSSITGLAVIRAGGGGGSVDATGTAGIGGSGGGGLAKKFGDGNAVSGTDNFGAGGGGAHSSSNAGNGGSGVVIIRYRFK